MPEPVGGEAKSAVLSSQQEIEELEQDRQRISLLDIVRNNLQKKGKTTILYRFIVCGELEAEVKQQEVGRKLSNDLLVILKLQTDIAHFQKVFKLVQSETEVITGLLLTYSKSFLHVVEGTQKGIQSFVRELGSNRTANGKPLFKNVRMLLSANDVPKRYFPFWASRIVEMRSMETGAGEYADPSSFTQDRIVDFVTECVILLTKLGLQLGESSKLDMKLAMDDLYQEHKNLFPKQELLIALANTEQLMTIQEWLNTYDGHTDLVLDGDLVWPVPRPIT